MDSAALQRSAFVYYLGRQSDGAAPLGCSCMLLEHIEWTELDPVVHPDETNPPEACVFDSLRQLCDQATRDGGMATIVCDDSGGLEQQCTADDYCTGLTRLASIARGNLLFADASGDIPWRVLHVVR